MPDALQAMMANHSANKTQLGKVEESKGRLEVIRQNLDSLLELGDNVTPEDVVKAAGGIVAGGMDAKSIAGMLADMPQGGEALSQWVKTHDADVTQRITQMQQAHSASLHQMGASAMDLLMHHAGQGPGQAPADPMASMMPPTGNSNPLGV